MSRQLTISATLCVIASAAAALAMSFAGPQSGDTRGAAAHGSLVSVLLRA